MARNQRILTITLILIRGECPRRSLRLSFIGENVGVNLTTWVCVASMLTSGVGQTPLLWHGRNTERLSR